MIESKERLYLIYGHQRYLMNCDITADVSIKETGTVPQFKETTELSAPDRPPTSDSDSLIENIIFNHLYMYIIYIIFLL